MPGRPAGAYHPGTSSDTPQKAAILHLNAFRSHRVAEILLRLGICAQRFAIGLVRCKAVELDHRKGLFGPSFGRKYPSNAPPHRAMIGGQAAA
jgi:hypothetical protein